MSVFHAYDIRGLAPGELDEDFSRRLARALVDQFTPKRVLVGRDMRLSSPALEKALVEELIKLGANVTRIGLCTTPMFNVLVGLANGSVDLGVMVTASHNPGKYNGYKIVRGDVSPIGQGSGMEELEQAFNSVKENVAAKPGTIFDDHAALTRYVEHILKLARLPEDMPKIKIAIDGGNGMAGAVLPTLIEKLRWLEVKPLYFEPDGSFPNHEANPLKRETLKDLSALVKRENCALGVAFDGDADRIGLVDENGQPIPGDLVTALIGQELVRLAGGGSILYDLRSSWSVPEAIEEAGGTSQMCRVGHAYIKRQMREEGALFAGEVSMHYYFKDLFNVESGDLVMLLVLRRLIEEGKTISQLWKPLSRYAHSGEINFQVSDQAGAVARVVEKYSSQATSTSELDGIRMEFRHETDPANDWWFNVRLSNTEPLVRLNLESKSQLLTEQKVAELSELIRGI